MNRVLLKTTDEGTFLYLMDRDIARELTTKLTEWLDDPEDTNSSYSFKVEAE